MNEAISVELHFFIISILWGAIILVVYDCLRILRRLISHNAIILAVEDLIFWVLSSVFIFAMIYNLNNGTVRGFSVMGMGLGMILYHYILSELIVGWITKFLMLLLAPFKFVIGKINKFLGFIFGKVKKAAGFILSRLKKLFKSVKIAMDKKKEKRTAKHIAKGKTGKKSQKRRKLKEGKSSKGDINSRGEEETTTQSRYINTVRLNSSIRNGSHGVVYNPRKKITKE